MRSHILKGDWFHNWVFARREPLSVKVIDGKLYANEPLCNDQLTVISGVIHWSAEVQFIPDEDELYRIDMEFDQ